MLDERSRWKSSIKYLASSIVLYYIPNCTHLREVDVSQFFAALVQFVLQSIESRHKFVSRALQRAFRIEFAFPCEIDDCEEQIAYFVFDFVARASSP
jgi:hypothetical protein